MPADWAPARRESTRATLRPMDRAARSTHRTSRVCEPHSQRPPRRYRLDPGLRLRSADPLPCGPGLCPVGLARAQPANLRGSALCGPGDQSLAADPAVLRLWSGAAADERQARAPRRAEGPPGPAGPALSVRGDCTDPAPGLDRGHGEGQLEPGPGRLVAGRVLPPGLRQRHSPEPPVVRALYRGLQPGGHRVAGLATADGGAGAGGGLAAPRPRPVDPADGLSEPGPPGVVRPIRPLQPPGHRLVQPRHVSRGVRPGLPHRAQRRHLAGFRAAALGFPRRRGPGPAGPDSHGRRRPRGDAL